MIFRLLSAGVCSVMLMAVSLFHKGLSSAHEDDNSGLETRCGWFSNPTPGNASLYDKDGEWIIGVQGGHQAEGDWPVFKDREFVHTNGASYGYGCACLRVRVNHETKEVLEIKSAHARPLAACRRDPALKEPK
ncbi:MAG TPA: DUF4087 domain-containing protein [Blastocatellia bacterium]|nr:DUF4087 domain-containing protein [Blastocatellia bacterium]